MFAIVGALTGGMIAVIGQYFVRLVDRRNAHTDLVSEQCAQLISLEEDLRNRVWEERRLGLRDVVSAWPIAEYRLAEARLKIACRDVELHDALRGMQTAGGELGRTWRQDLPDDEVEEAWLRHREALDHLITVSGTVAAKSDEKPWRRSLR